VFEDTNTGMYRTVILWVELSVALREEHRLRVFEREQGAEDGIRA
jgi:hypothetical protein